MMVHGKYCKLKMVSGFDYYKSIVEFKVAGANEYIIADFFNRNFKLVVIYTKECSRVYDLDLSNAEIETLKTTCERRKEEKRV